MIGDSDDGKSTLGIILIFISMIIILVPAYLSEDAMGLGCVMGFILMALGAVLLLSSGVDSLLEWKRGTKDISVKISGLMIIFWVVFFIMNVLLPDSQEFPALVVWTIIIIALMAIVKYTTKKQS
ncbi:MAG: hypothetical protein PHU53_02900 [Thermoplasmata archaeon]|nr:hypothetical protein [Thermoplasmata archaeon]